MVAATGRGAPTSCMPALAGPLRYHHRTTATTANRVANVERQACGQAGAGIDIHARSIQSSQHRLRGAADTHLPRAGSAAAVEARLWMQPLSICRPCLVGNCCFFCRLMRSTICVCSIFRPLSSVIRRCDLGQLPHHITLRHSFRHSSSHNSASAITAAIIAPMTPATLAARALFEPLDALGGSSDG